MDPPNIEPRVPVDIAASQAARLQLANVRIVLVDTLLTRNIGAAARAMKTMGLVRLQLVRPQQLPDGEAYKLAAGSEDVLNSAEVFPDLATAISDCALIFGVSARRRRISLPLDSPASAADAGLGLGQAVAFVFGGEEAGLNNADLLLCHRLLQIPSDHEFGSLNLAAAVQVIAYELRKAALRERTPAPVARRAPQAEFEQFMAHLLLRMQPDSGANSLLAERLRRLLQRAEPSRAELRMLRGLIGNLRRPASSKPR